MNEAAQIYWKEYWNCTEKPASVNAWMFGVSPDELAQLVIDGKKTATCSGHVFYELDKEPLPKVDEYSIILNGKEEPVAIIKIVDVSIMSMNEVPEELALAEGEGPYEYWKSAHEAFFTSELKTVGLEFSDDMLLVCERFQLIDVKTK
ncbi:ASCH domain-containing protein [Sporosarcina sp. G11-34]|uniref:ASCH domain-containing protein n=1 Tax=Sporosarcina sp. G11-34 TaxID=2849605 RepID=UPI0022A92469|nr:ASCH domain-containing protein [Sporosarcina sp. G11-34]MCZ2256870.1 ASCH domain-containing protein [Sporosarcina sp. G11-34]